MYCRYFLARAQLLVNSTKTKIFSMFFAYNRNDPNSELKLSKKITGQQIMFPKLAGSRNEYRRPCEQPAAAVGQKTETRRSRPEIYPNSSLAGRTRIYRQKQSELDQKTVRTDCGGVCQKTETRRSRPENYPNSSLAGRGFIDRNNPN